MEKRIHLIKKLKVCGGYLETQSVITEGQMFSNMPYAMNSHSIQLVLVEDSENGFVKEFQNRP